MLGLLIVAAANVAIGLVTLFLYAWGVTLVGLKITIPFIVAWLIILYFPWSWFVEAA